MTHCRLWEGKRVHFPSLFRSFHFGVTVCKFGAANSNILPRAWRELFFNKLRLFQGDPFCVIRIIDWDCILAWSLSILLCRLLWVHLAKIGFFSYRLSYKTQPQPIVHKQSPGLSQYWLVSFQTQRGVQAPLCSQGWGAWLPLSRLG